MSPLRGLVGTVAYGEADFFCGPVGRNTVNSEFSLEGVKSLPRVDIVMAYENMDGALIDAAVAAGAKGDRDRGRGERQHDGAGRQGPGRAGEEGDRLRPLVARRARARVGRNVELDDDKLGFVASLGMNPQKARVLLRLALLRTNDVKQIQKYFEEY